MRLEPLLIGSIFPIHGEDRIVVTPQRGAAAAAGGAEGGGGSQVRSLITASIRKRMLRALWVDVRAGQIEQGGSTLTQQLVKSYFLDPRRTSRASCEKRSMAVALESHFSKADLMNAYINEIFLGQDGDRAIHGFGLASQFYFGKPLSELDLSEIALLVAIVRGPSYYDPRRHAQRALARRDLVLKLMAEQRIISAKDAQAASANRSESSRAAPGAYYPAYLDFVRRVLRRDYREEDLTEGGPAHLHEPRAARAGAGRARAGHASSTRLDRGKKYPERRAGRRGRRDDSRKAAM